MIVRFSLLILLCAGYIGFISNSQAQEPPPAYASCVACHGDKGQGNQLLNVPAIAGQPKWYVSRQLNHFLDGIRGSHPSDKSGLQMQTAISNQDIKSNIPELASYISSLPTVKNDEPISGNLMNGSRYYQAQCGACHGGQAQGNLSFNAPNLSILDSHYIKRQMKHFVDGVRGTHKDDKLGKQMAMMARVVNEKELNDIVFFIAKQSQ